MKRTSTVRRRALLRRGLLAGGGAVLASELTTVQGEAGAPPWQIGCYTRPWAEHDYQVALDGIAESGYEYAGLMTQKGGVIVSVDTTPEQAAAVGEEIRKRGLKSISLYGGGFPVQKSIDAGIAGLRRLIDNAAASQTPHLLLGGTREELADAYYKVVAECCDYAAGKGIGLSVKPHGGANANGAQCRKIIEQAGHKNFRIWYDPGNIFFYSRGELDPVDDAATVDGLVVGMSVKDFLPPKNVQLTPGTGRVDFPKVMARLRAGGFTGGPLVVECVETADAAHITAEARKARRFVEQLTA